VEHVRLDSTTFEFSGTNAPLSWHLTGRDKKRLDDEWTIKSSGPGVEDVRKFLRMEKLKTTDRAAYDAAIDCN
jgi:hypothetical protein